MSLELKGEFSNLSWLLQIVCACWVPVFGMATLADLAGVKETTAFDYIASGLVSSLLARVVFCLRPVSALEGSWVWSLPMMIELICMVWSLCSGGSARGSASVRRMFYEDGGPMSGEETGWIITLLTLPAWNCVCYSVVMWRSAKARQ